LDAARVLTMRSEPWLSCDDCFEVIDRVADEVVSGAATSIVEAERVHLAGCAPCHEEAQSLVALAAIDRGINPDDSVARLEAVLDECKSPLNETPHRTG
ncbi:MAG: hypothetical protein ACRDZT_01665, partial [Acidimicrobiales bacterium]